MDNSEIADRFNLLSRLMDIHGENVHKIRSYANASQSIERLVIPLGDTSSEDIFQIRGIGDAIGNKILEMLRTGRFPLLEEYLQKTPEGIVEMMSIKGLGPKKIATIWKELELETMGELLYACNENRLLNYKGFGKKSQDQIRQSIEFYLSNLGSFRWADLEEEAFRLVEYGKKHLHPSPLAITGDFRRQEPVISRLELLAGTDRERVSSLAGNGLELLDQGVNRVSFQGEGKLRVDIHCCAPGEFAWQLFNTTGSASFLEKFREFTSAKSFASASSEQEIFQQAGLAYIPAPMREGRGEIEAAASGFIPTLIDQQNIRGIIHAHSNWSDGENSLEEMAIGCMKQGFEYLVISDHSRSAFYANGLNPERIAAQHREVNALNDRLAPFRIFKSIESDILGDGSLDYPPEVLATFDLVIASVHSNLKMTLEKAMERLLGAIRNPYTTILGHPTGRLLLSRPGYPVDHERIIEECLSHQVAIEINAHPSRLDLDWNWIDHAVNKGVKVSIDPDAHSVSGFRDIRYGVLMAQKAGLSATSNLSSLGREELANYISARKTRNGI